MMENTYENRLLMQNNLQTGLRKIVNKAKESSLFTNKIIKNSRAKFTFTSRCKLMLEVKDEQLNGRLLLKETVKSAQRTSKHFKVFWTYLDYDINSPFDRRIIKNIPVKQCYFDTKDLSDYWKEESSIKFFISRHVIERTALRGRDSRVAACLTTLTPFISALIDSYKSVNKEPKSGDYMLVSRELYVGFKVIDNNEIVITTILYKKQWSNKQIVKLSSLIKSLDSVVKNSSPKTIEKFKTAVIMYEIPSSLYYGKSNEPVEEDAGNILVGFHSSIKY
jgi:hypothetical protein